LNSDGTNWWAPNLAGLHAMLGSAGFEPYQTILAGGRACVHSRRVERPWDREWADAIKFGELPPDHPLASLLEDAGAVHEQTTATGSAPGDGDTADESAVPGERSSHAEQLLSRLLAQALAAQSQQALHLQQLLARCRAENADLAARAHWLEEQSRAARQALAAVERGRVLRILRWLRRAK
jgi:hypothetical protein